MQKRRSVKFAGGGVMTAVLVLGAIQVGDLGGETVSAVGEPSRDSDVSRGDLDALAARISADMHRWDGSFTMRRVVVDDSGFVSVGVDDPAKAEPILNRAFGKKHIEVKHVEQAHLF
ncbi:hypothetical protein [Streptomyces albidus (ex Kaewkla and Franco 2022)]|uniref:hypothetical protein n=1 Tax=Streptomyces albidus (ex Kaewkla and Franco 2022) TaxID=722709 RepID=UPI0015EE848D|nr:hypothetical protein [Streptomyces albidus (ex Kaewkla and Franco 2022)]